MEKRISVNQFAEYSRAKTEKGKLSIIKRHKEPSDVDDIMKRWYRLAKSRMRKCLLSQGDLMPIYDGLETLQTQKPEGIMRQRNRKVSIEALEEFLQIQLPGFITNGKLTPIKPNRKSLYLNGVSIFVSPEVVFKIKGEDGVEYLGCVKLHVSKKAFSFETSELVSAISYKYLKEIGEESGRIADPRYCITIDVFGKRIVPAPMNSNKLDHTIDFLCEEFVRLWSAA